MPFNWLRTLVAGSVAAALSGCAAEHTGLPYMGGPDNFGEANRQTMAAQVIDPTPEYSDVVPATSAEHAAQAIARYDADKVKIPDVVKTSKNIVQGSGSSPK